MPKITVHGGPTNAAEAIPRPGEGAFFQNASEPESAVTVDPDSDSGTEGGEQPSPGNSSSPSSPRTEKSGEPSGRTSRRRVPTTENPSK